MICEKCGNDNSITGKNCNCLKDADFTDVKNNSKWIHVLVIGIIFTAIIYYQYLNTFNNIDNKDKPQKSGFDISKGKEKYGDWYRDGNFYRNDTGGLSAIIHHKKKGVAELWFIVPSKKCTEKSNSGYEQVITVNNIPVKYERYCFSRGFERYIPAEIAENEITTKEFIKSKGVLVKDFWFAPDAYFSAIGFTNAFHFLTK